MTENAIACRKNVIAILKKHAASLSKNPVKGSAAHLAWLEKNITKQEKKLAKFL